MPMPRFSGVSLSSLRIFFKISSCVAYCFAYRCRLYLYGLSYNCESRPRGGGGGVVLLALPAFLPSLISFLLKIRAWVGEGGAPGPSPRSATVQLYFRREHC